MEPHCWTKVLVTFIKSNRIETNLHVMITVDSEVFAILVFSKYW